MGLFSKKEEWEESFRLDTRGRGGRGFCSVIFWLWGLGGLALIGAEFNSISGSVGVGTSSYIAAHCAYWIGGMVLFGIGAIIDSPGYSAVKRVQDAYGDVRVSR